MRFAVIGHPVAHSKSPAMHGAAYRALGLAHVYEKLDTPHDALAARVAELRHHDLDGINVTVPHKTAVLALVDDVAATAQAIGAANTLVRNVDGRIVAHNTDAPALIEEIARLGPVSFANRSGVVIGSGGAARAAVFALRELGVAPIEIRSRRPLEGAVNVSHVGLSAPPREREDLGVIVQCTTAGMEHGAPGSVAVDAIAWSSVPDDCLAYDVVYAPPLTPFLARAAERGLPHDNGLGMLVAQGAIAFELWLGISPPRDVMRAVLSSKS
jgi:shikimate dehydrogenase